MTGRDPLYAQGVLCLLAAGFFTSTAGILLRWVESADGWQLLFYRSATFVLVLFGFVLLRHRGRVVESFRATGRSGLVVALALGTAFMAFILALLETTVANVVFIVGCSPFFAAFLAWLLLREPVRGGLWLAMAGAVIGIAVMFAGGFAGGALGGNLLALLACLCYATTLVAFRRGRAVDMLPAVCLAGVVATLVSALFVENFRISAHDLTIAITLGVVQLGLQYILVTAGSRHVPAAEIALLSRISIILSPLWVWIGVGEVPNHSTLIGGAIVLTAVIGQAVWSLRAGAPAARV